MGGGREKQHVQLKRCVAYATDLKYISRYVILDRLFKVFDFKKAAIYQYLFSFIAVTTIIVTLCLYKPLQPVSTHRSHSDAQTIPAGHQRPAPCLGQTDTSSQQQRFHYMYLLATAVVSLLLSLHYLHLIGSHLSVPVASTDNGHLM